MKLDQLLVLEKVVELGSVSAASQALNRTQPAISHTLKQLERDLNVEILDRSGYRLTLSDKGRHILGSAKGVLAAVDDLRRLADHLAAGKEESLAISYDGATDLSVLRDALNMVARDYPETSVYLRQEQLTGSLEAVETGEVDIGIAPLPVEILAERELDYFSLSAQRLVNVSASTLSQDERYRMLPQVVAQDSGQLTKGTEFGVRAGQRKWYTNTLAAKKWLLCAGLGWGRLPQSMLETELAAGDLVELTSERSQFPVDLKMVVFRKSPHLPKPITDQVWEILRDASEKP